MWKIQLTIAINFISFVDNDKERVIYSKIDNIKIMMNDDADEVIKVVSLSLILVFYCIINVNKINVIK